MSAPQTEVERKFLLTGLPALDWEREDALRQGYVALDGPTEVRLRFEDRGPVLTVKRGSGLVRVEEEVVVGGEQAERLWALTEGRRIEKVRRRASLGDGVVVEVDEYAGDLAGLLVAEVEFPDREAAEAFAPPAWLGAEVTEDARYKNRALACDGRPA
jgi:adenylate cyclase